MSRLIGLGPCDDEPKGWRGGMNWSFDDEPKGGLVGQVNGWSSLKMSEKFERWNGNGAVTVGEFIVSGFDRLIRLVTFDDEPKVG